MKKIWKSTNNTSVNKKFLIPKNQDESNQEWVEITIDYNSNVFTARKIKDLSLNEEWEEYNDYTFPSSLLNEFLNTSKSIQDI
ncbi:MAG: hypothetical protein JWQ40_5084 [Segetibacter sp.]|jgi:hypothetical protein|nr:hypothetical protein [Segetibacter sp.]